MSMEVNNLFNIDISKESNDSSKVEIKQNIINEGLDKKYQITFKAEDGTLIQRDFIREGKRESFITSDGLSFFAEDSDNIPGDDQFIVLKEEYSNE